MDPVFPGTVGRGKKPAPVGGAPDALYLRMPEHPPPVAPARAPPQTELLALDPPSPWDQGGAAATGRDPFDQSLPGDDGTWSA